MLSEREYKDYKRRAVIADVVIAATIIFLIMIMWFIGRPDDEHWEQKSFGTVTSITGSISKSGYYNPEIFVRLPDGSTREFGINMVGALRCNVGETVPLLQQGVSFTLDPKACPALAAKDKK